MKNLLKIVVAIFVFGSGFAKPITGKCAIADKKDKGVEVQCEKSVEKKSVTDRKAIKKIDFNFNDLLEVAKKARENAYSPYSKFKVGAAVLSTSGKVYTGCNVENASYGITCCAERTAIFKAVSEGEKGNFIKAIAIVLDAPEFGAPCGACRQVINEFAEPNAIIIMGTMNGNYKIECLETLLPYAFKLDEKEAAK
ncbi:MAG: Cytidine deaminase [candidate division TM6 bacterium GW2011_GWF2_37_49]|nr:MAG: Cytidine deaminase [candidate division TM6 bacterium GW2011_GWF2_37_49]